MPLPRERIAGCARNIRQTRNVSPGVTNVRRIEISGRMIVSRVRTTGINGLMIVIVIVIVARDPIDPSGLTGRTDGIDPPHHVLSGHRLICESFRIKPGSSFPPSCARKG